jgi:hypothetical protein
MLFYPSSVGPQFTTFARGSERDAIIDLKADGASPTAAVCATCDAQTCSGLAGVLLTDTILSIPPGPALTVRIDWRNQSL